MNHFVGGWSGWPWLEDNQYKVHHTYADVGATSKLFTFIEMPAQSINAGNFRVAPTLKGGESFYVPANSSFSVKVSAVTDYCCSYIKE